MRILSGLLTALAMVLTFNAAPAAAQDKVVYHIDDAALQATRALRAIRNHLDTKPDAKISVVAHADGLDFLLDGAKDTKNKIDYASLVGDLDARGVKFYVCEITAKLRNLDKSKFMLEAQYTPSGVVYITELQMKEGFAYIKP